MAVCEDEQADRDDFTGILKTLLDKYTEEYRITNFTSGGELLQSGGSFHLVFMDIMMEGRNGLETGQELLQPKPFHKDHIYHQLRAILHGCGEHRTCLCFSGKASVGGSTGGTVAGIPAAVPKGGGKAAIITSVILVCVTQGNIGTYTLIGNIPFYVVLFVLAVLSVYLSIHNIETKDVM
ncbi:response regulator [Lachnospiraceae bacterium]|nr:response regulator [Lachnospiraceae bacterium]